MKTMKIDVDIPVSIYKEDDTFIAYCPVLDISTSASSAEKVRDRFHQVVEIFFEETIKKGTLEENLLNYGWKKKKTWTPPAMISCEPEKVSLSLS
ncbi:MAG: hypothetical protein NTW79_00245 [Candidatus Berkelbacteria bacterium]|nr:hypothetical protein [Candidatus Berkelbacteria bacterium]